MPPNGKGVLAGTPGIPNDPNDSLDFDITEPADIQAGYLAAVDYARRGWPVFPVRADKRPVTAHGRSDATIAEPILRAWWQRWPDALPSIATGGESGVIVVDVDIRPDLDGRDSLQALGVDFHPETPTAHSPSGGYHMFFRHPGGHVKTIANRLGRGLDLRGDGGSIILPPGPGRAWDPHLGLDTPLADFPDWARIPEPSAPPIDQNARPREPISRYAMAALDGAVAAILAAAAGAQEQTLNGQAFGIGRLAGAGAVPAGIALQSVLWAARRMPVHDPRRPWRVGDVEGKVRRAFSDGLLRPRAVRHGR